jgi:CheY-like chemotaxis protein
VLPDDVARCSAAGMQGHVAKPILREDLLAAIQKAVRSRSPAAA